MVADGQREPIVRRDVWWRAIVAGSVVAIVRLTAEYPLLDIAQALREGGIRTIEFPLTTPGALDAVTSCRDKLGDVVTGVGTVHTAADAQRAIDSGAQFVASYGFDPAVVATAREHDVLALPGVMTPTEIVTAWNAGADAAKIYPAGTLGPGYLTQLRGPLPHIPLLASGGISSAEVHRYLRAGAAAVGVGDLLEPDILEASDWPSVTVRAQALINSI
jgi:2-dehydro-3-deoxyphosphogluconate aldolase / (4S)-4-hydroxy-2-oxoglutarate aldolase